MRNIAHALTLSFGITDRLSINSLSLALASAESLPCTDNQACKSDDKHRTIRLTTSSSLTRHKANAERLYLWSVYKPLYTLPYDAGPAHTNSFVR